VEEAAAGAGRCIDPEHWGALVPYLPDGQAMPESLADLLRQRRPDVDPAEIVMAGQRSLGPALERFIAVGVSKFVIVPWVSPPDWQDELASLAEVVLPLQN
jgi:hypothetical protein